MKIFGAVVLCCFSFCKHVDAQTSLPGDSVCARKADKKREFMRSVKVSGALIAVGAYMTIDDNHNVINRYKVREERQEHFGNFKTNVDDYLIYAPIAGVYTLNALGLKGKNNFGNRTALLIKSEVIMLALTGSIKRLAGEPRPDRPYERNSFPSGHTAQAFMAATFMHKEYGAEHPAISVLAYGTAATVGAMRILNDRHWISDVFAGAGIGILSTNLAYLTHQYKWGRRPSKTSLLVAPMYGSGAYGMSAVLHFN